MLDFGLTNVQLMPQALRPETTPSDRHRMLGALTHSSSPGQYIPFSFIISVLLTRSAGEKLKIAEEWHAEAVERLLQSARIHLVDGTDEVSPVSMLCKAVLTCQD